MDQPAYYRTVDPIQNLRIRIRIERTKAGKGHGGAEPHADAGSDSDEERPKPRAAAADRSKKVWEQTFEWQEKVYGPREILVHRPGGIDGQVGTDDDKLGKTAVEMEYREHIQALAKQHPDGPLSLLREYEDGRGKKKRGVWLFTYTDKDGFVPKRELHKRTTTSVRDGFGELSNLAESVVRLPARGGGGGDGDDLGAVNDNTAAERLHREAPFRTFFVMAAVDVRDRDLPDADDWEGKAPQFFEVPLCCVKAYRDGNMVEVTPALTEPLSAAEAADAHQRAGKAGGAFKDPSGNPLRNVYSFHTPAGALYNYTVSVPYDPSDEREQREADDERALLAAEVAAARQGYELDHSRVGQQLSGQVATNNQRAHVMMEVVSAGGFRGEHLYVQYEAALPRTAGWKWAHEATAEELEEGGAKVAREFAKYLSHDDKLKLYRQCGTSQTCRVSHRFQGHGSDPRTQWHSRRGREGDGYAHEAKVPGKQRMKPAGAGGANAEAVVGPVAHFGYLVQMELVNTQHLPMGSGDDQLQVLFAVKSRDSWGRHRIEGYTHFTLPPEPGSYDMHLRCWKPSGSVREKMADFFVGGALLLQDGSYAGIPLTHRGPFMNKYGFQTETSGTVRVKVHYALQGKFDPGQDWEGAGPIGRELLKKNKKVLSKHGTIDELMKSLRRGGVHLERLKGATIASSRENLQDRLRSHLTPSKGGDPLNRTAPAGLESARSGGGDDDDKAAARTARRERLKQMRRSSTKET